MITSDFISRLLTAGVYFLSWGKNTLCVESTRSPFGRLSRLYIVLVVQDYEYDFILRDCRYS